MSGAPGPSRAAGVRSGLLAAALALACRHFDVCGLGHVCAALPERDAGASSIGASEPSDAGQSGDAPGEAGVSSALECTGTLLDCDTSTLNGCETDVSSDPFHCGSCGAPCDGICVRSSCQPFRVIEPRRVEAESPPALESDYVFSLTAPQAGGAFTLRRVRRSDGELLTLADSAWPSVSGLAAGAARVYVTSEDGVFSVPFEGGELKLETGAVEQLATAGAHVALIADGQLSSRLGDTGSFRPAPEAVGSVFLIRGGQRLLLIASVATLATLDLATNELVPFPMGDIELVDELGPLDDSQSDAVAYFVGSTRAGPTLLYRASTGAAPEPLVEMAEVTSWSVSPLYPRPFYGAPCLIATFERGREHGLRIVSLRDPSQRFEWRTRGQLEWLAVSATSTLPVPSTEAWFFERFNRALVSLSLDALLGAL